MSNLLSSSHSTGNNPSFTRSASAHSSACTSHSQSDNRPSTFQLQRNATQHSLQVSLIPTRQNRPKTGANKLILHVNLIPTILHWSSYKQTIANEQSFACTPTSTTNNLLRGLLVRSHLHVRLFLIATTVQVLIRYRGTLLSILCK
jgi:hypothetical protein